MTDLQAAQSTDYVEGPPPPRPGSSISVRGLNHAYGSGENRKPVLYDVDLDVEPGSIVILTGPSGSGKTTLLTVIGALRSVQAGGVRVLGTDLAGLDGKGLMRVRRQLGFIFQHHNLFGALTALQNVLLALEWSPCPAADRMPRSVALLERLGLGRRLHHRPDSLSGGQRQRVAIARALVHEPQLILADEPTASLDQGTGRDVVELFQDLAWRQGRTVLMITHDARIFDAANRLVTLVDGRVVEDRPGQAAKR